MTSLLTSDRSLWNAFPRPIVKVPQPLAGTSHSLNCLYNCKFVNRLLFMDRKPIEGNDLRLQKSTR